MERFTFNLPEKEKEKLETAVERDEFTSIAEAIRHLIRSYEVKV
ncbi:MAG: ribbon-helix-helix domain-containing protein [Candidatus Nanohaloarchaea archaeon]